MKSTAFDDRNPKNIPETVWMKRIALLRRIAWASWICVGPLIFVFRLAASRDIVHLRDWELENAIVASLVWTGIAAPVTLLLYYACKYAVTGQIGDRPAKPDP